MLKIKLDSHDATKDITDCFFYFLRLPFVPSTTQLIYLNLHFLERISVR